MRSFTRHALLLLLAAALSGCISSRKIVAGSVGPAPADATASAISSATGYGPYRIGPDDVIAVRVFREPDLSFDQVRIDTEGRFEMPLIGRIEASGKSPDQLSREIASRYGADYLVDPQIAINVIEANSKRVTVEGAVNRPGLFTQATPIDLLTAVAMAGGPTDIAKLDEVAVFRKIDGQNMVAAFDLKRVRSGEMENPTILPGDTVVIGYSGLRSGLQDFLGLAPIFSVFRAF